MKHLDDLVGQTLTYCADTVNGVVIKTSELYNLQLFISHSVGGPINPEKYYGQRISGVAIRNRESDNYPGRYLGIRFEEGSCILFDLDVNDNKSQYSIITAEKSVFSLLWKDLPEEYTTLGCDPAYYGMPEMEEPPQVKLISRYLLL